MRITHVIAACAALITAFHRAETVDSESSSKSKEDLLQSSSENVTDVSEITFTTLRPEVTSFSNKALWNVYLMPRKPPKGRPNRSSLSQLRGPNYYKDGRRRRQIHRLVRSSSPTSVFSSKSSTPILSSKSSNIAKNSHGIGRSLDIADNQIEQHQIEAIQPAEAFEDGAIHIEPIYRVTKNKNVLDSITGILKRLIDPPKSIGPLVGPFHFPGVGDKVYIRLLEPVDSDHLVIRLVTHAHGQEADVTADHGVLPSSDLAIHAKLPSITHESLGLADTFKPTLSIPHGVLKPGLTGTDSLLSSSNNLAQFAKSPSTLGQGLLTGDGRKPVSKTYGTNVKDGKLVSLQPANDPHMLNYRPLTTTNNVDWSTFKKLTEQKNSTQDVYGSFEYPFAQTYQFQSTLNDTSKEAPLTFGVHEALGTMQIPNFAPVAQVDPVFPLADPFAGGLHVQDSAAVGTIAVPSFEEQPRYSLDFASKKMRYLNLDGSVETPGETVMSEGFRPMEQAASPKLARSVSLHWEPFKEMNSGSKEVADAQKRSGKACRRGSCQENEKREQQIERTVSNSTMPSVKSTMQLLHLQRNLTKPRH